MNAATRSESNYDRILLNAGVTVKPINEARTTRPDRELILHGQKVVAEWKEKIKGAFESNMIQSRTHFSFWGCEEGSQQIRPNGRVDWSGWAGHLAKAIQQLKDASEDGLPTLAGLQSHSIKAELDPTSLFILMYGHGARVNENRLIVSQNDCAGELPVAAGFADWPVLSAVGYLVGEKISVYANCFARVPLDPAWFQYDCFGPVYIPGGNHNSPTWQEWRSGEMPIRGVVR
ncbi:hypothetical protein [Aureliella helgolandensis]|uniref:Uncharacterized protein n=1 Tax=Aureliella helgolandensis TaxID=2527968 RepID=A0A518GBT6_9BACT|nr:hypothetical protein [Aureliella helgolandensis]QDV26049.1 hypothetical protein Q31a_44200 [Aureliella helgolandensis]